MTLLTVMEYLVYVTNDRGSVSFVVITFWSVSLYDLSSGLLKEQHNWCHMRRRNCLPF